MADETPASGDGAIILLGHQSHEVLDHGRYRMELSDVAKARCEKAAELARQNPDYLILPTGGFGAFNRTTIPHGALLREHLVALGIPSERILYATNSSNTVEDSLCARNRLVRLGRTKAFVVTSDYHMRRASYIFRRNLRDFDLTFAEADGSAVDPRESLSESRKLTVLQNEWIDVPLYGTPEGSEQSLSEAYGQAAAEHKHYDTVSTVVISGLFIVFGFPYTLTAHAGGFVPYIYLFSAAAIIFLWLIYDRMAWNARMARRVLQYIEAQLGGGFSLSYPRQDQFHRLSLFVRLSQRGVSITRAVNSMALVMLLIQLGFAGALFAHL